MTARKLPLSLLLLLGALTAFGPLSIDMYLPAFPQISGELGGGNVEVTLAAFLLSMGSCQILYGPLADRYGRKPPLLIGCALFLVGSIGCALTLSLPWLTAARFVQGLGGAAGVVIARATVRDLFEEREVARIFSQLMLVMGVAPILAPWLGGQVLLMGSWRAIFYLLALFGAACFLGVALRLPETLPHERRVRGGLRVAMGNFRDLLRNRSFVGYALAGGMNSAVMFAYIAGSPFVFMRLHGISEQSYGALFGANALGLVAATQINRLLLRRWSPHTILSASVTAAGIGTVLLLGVAPLGSFPLFFAVLFAVLFCIGLVYPNLAAVALGPHGRHAGSASALLGASQFLIGGTAGACVGLLNDGTALAMTGVMAFCGIAGWAFLRILSGAGEKD